MSKPRRKKTSLIYDLKRKVKFGAREKGIFLEHLRKTGTLYIAAEMAGVSYATVKDHKRTDEEFKAACDLALNLYRDRLEQEILRRAVEGWDEPVIKNTAAANEDPDWDVVGHIRKFSDALLMFHAKRHIVGYREDRTDDEGGEGGVLVVPGQAVSEAEWEKQHKE